MSGECVAVTLNPQINTLIMFGMLLAVTFMVAIWALRRVEKLERQHDELVDLVTETEPEPHDR